MSLEIRMSGDLKLNACLLRVTIKQLCIHLLFCLGDVKLENLVLKENALVRTRSSFSVYEYILLFSTI